MTKAIDLLGRELSVGDHVIFSVKGYGSQGELRHGFVRKITNDRHPVDFYVHLEAAEGHRRPIERHSSDVAKVVLP
jgi:hypothetical protein